MCKRVETPQTKEGDKGIEGRVRECERGEGREGIEKVCQKGVEKKRPSTVLKGIRL